MKVQPDINDIIPKGIKPGKPAARPSVNTANSINSKKNRLMDQHLQQSILSRLNMERTLGDALSIAQVSRSLIQKAMEVSSRLRNIAASAMTSGNIDTEELDNAMSDISSSMGRFGESVTAPVHTFKDADERSFRIDSVDREMGRVKDLAGKMAEGNIPSSREFDLAASDLTEKNEALGLTIDRIRESMVTVAGQYGDNSGSDIDAVVGGLVKDIGSNPESALMAQGNISPDVANSIFNA